MRVKPHEVTVVFGYLAVDAYLDGEKDRKTLSKLGALKTYFFDTVPEMNAFIIGIEEAVGYDDALPIE